MELYIIRHAQSFNNALTDIRQRVCDPELTELGRRQAELLARHLAGGVSLELSVGATDEATSTRSQRGYGLTRLYCSAMCRALQTTQPISRELGLKPEVWVDIHEHGGIYLDHGEEGGVVGYPGKTRPEILAEFPGYILPEMLTDKGWWTGAEEDWPSAQGRALKVAALLRGQAASSDRIGLVSHGGFVDALFKALLNQLPSTQVFYSHFNTAISRIDFHPDGRLNIRYLNRIGHLPPELVS